MKKILKLFELKKNSTEKEGKNEYFCDKNIKKTG